MRAGAFTLALSFCAATAFTQTDPLLDQQWYIEPERDVIVALLDYGIDSNHEDLQGRFWSNPSDGSIGWDFVDADNDPTDPCNGHGTQTAGPLGAVRDNGIGIAGVAEHVSFMVLRVLGCSGTGTEQGLVDAINFAKDNGAHMIQAVVLVSGAWNVPCWNQPGCLTNLCQAIEDSGLLFLNPSGNEGLDLTGLYRYPMSCAKPNQITVTASDENDQLAPFASVGPLVDLAAPGDDILTTDMGSTYTTVDGSSYATPQVSAVAAWHLWLSPGLPVADLRTRVLQHVDVLPQYAQTASGGRLSAFWPVSTAVAPPPPPPPPPTGVQEFLMDDTVGCPSCPQLVAGLSPDGGTSGDFSNDWYTSAEFPSGAFSLTAWINMDTFNDRRPVVSKQGGGERGFVWMASHFSGKMRIEIWPAGASSPTTIDSATTLVPGTTYQVALTHDGSTLKIYVGGVLETTFAIGLPRTNSQPLDVGRYFWGSSYSRYFDGRLDNVRVYDRALSAAEVAAEP